jgi:hypothetical protein
MASSTHGASTSQVEVGNVDSHGLWLIIDDKEFFLPYEAFPWFRKATIDQILNVQLLHGDHLHWPDLDIDLEINSLVEPESFPLIFK